MTMNAPVYMPPAVSRSAPQTPLLWLCISVVFQQSLKKNSRSNKVDILPVIVEVQWPIWGYTIWMDGWWYQYSYNATTMRSPYTNIYTKEHVCMLIMQTATQNTAEPVLKISNYRKKLSHRIWLERWNPYDNTNTCHTCLVSIVVWVFWCFCRRYSDDVTCRMSNKMLIFRIFK